MSPDRKSKKLQKKQEKLQKYHSKPQHNPQKQKPPTKSQSNQYNPLTIEKHWFSFWEHQNLFKPTISTKKPYTIILPPPNVTGSLHIGHTMMLALQDILIRYYRMNKVPTLYLPGTDHAGIATQTVIEKNLSLQNINLNSLSKEEKLDLLYKHTHIYQTRIYSQIKRIGASLDFSRQKFTMDPSINKAVIHAFITLYNKNLIYRDNRLVNWCGALHTSISDLEVDNREITPNTVIKVDKGEYLFGVMYYIDYPLINEGDIIEGVSSVSDSSVLEGGKGSGESLTVLESGISNFSISSVSNTTVNTDKQHPFINTTGTTLITNTYSYITIATTRPETILGDTALCANPTLIYLKGKKAINPLTGKIIPIIFDEQATLDMGTGVLKITPAHDFNDFELSRKYNLDVIRVLNEDNNIEITSIIKGMEIKGGGVSNKDMEIKGVGYKGIELEGVSNKDIELEGVSGSTKEQQGVSDKSIELECVSNKNNGIGEISTSTNTTQITNNIIYSNLQFLKSINGRKRFEARSKIMAHLKSINLFKKEQPHTYTLPFCSRSGDIIEPILKKQWWLKCSNMAQNAIHLVATNQIEIIPDECKNRWFKWLENIRDWCLSRQLVWGHRVPAYRVYVNNVRQGWVVGKDKDEAMRNYLKSASGSDNNDSNACDIKPTNSNPDNIITLLQDDDVLDTWFSSGLWPFTVMGWPDNTKDYNYFYPNSVLETGSDILFFWVARMVMLGVELTNKIPFTKILLHGLIRDSHGKKMSKSVGNVIDPIDVIEGISIDKLVTRVSNSNMGDKEIKRAIEALRVDFPRGIGECGADALRFGLCCYCSGVKDINLDVLRIEGYRKMCNKIWNAYKFIEGVSGQSNGLGSVNNSTNEQQGVNNKSINNNRAARFNPNPNTMYFIMNNSNILTGVLEYDLVLQWIYEKRNICIEEYVKGITDYNFMGVCSSIHRYFIYDFCDVFIELCKVRKEWEYVVVLVSVFYDVLKMFSTVMPFISEEIYQKMVGRYEEVKGKYIRGEDSKVEGVNNCTNEQQGVNTNTNKQHPFSNNTVEQQGVNTNIYFPNNTSNMVTDLTPVSICIADFPVRRGCYDLRFTSLVEVVKRIRSIVNSCDIRKCSVGVLWGDNKWVEGYLWVIRKLVKEVVTVEGVDRIEGQYIDEVDGIRVCVNDVGERVERDVSDGSS